jgi:hypothetical protein
MSGFTFGYLPHLQAAGAFQDPHRSNGMSIFMIRACFAPLA